MIRAIDIKDLTYALLTSANVAGTAPTYGTPVKVAGLVSAKITPKGDTQNQYSDGVLSDSVDFIGSYEVELEVTDIDFATQAVWLGHTITGGVMEEQDLDQAPLLAIAFRAMKSNKKYRYVRMLCGKFSIPDEESKSKTEKLELQTAKIKGVFFARAYDEKLKQTTDEDQTDYNAATGAAWFTSFGAADSTPPTISSVTPAANATGVAIGTTVAWVFSEAIAPACVNSGNFAVVKDTDGSNVAGALVQSNGGKTVTFTPTGNLTAAAAYRAIVTPGVTDLAGNHLAAPSVTKFTCA